MTFGTEKNENGLAIRRSNKFEDTVTRFDRMYESDRHTYRQTNGHTDVHRMTVYAALAQHRAAKMLVGEFVVKR